ncbi:hypothetical protein SB773_31130, partial [Bacillus sp. SIMBA_074]|uniref:hypothetical protein n=1 Tax=Bacillus sp. SIMBA_074 TaxID=3085812 RepID=UPI00397DAFBA
KFCLAIASPNPVPELLEDTSIVGYNKFNGGEGEDFLLISMGSERMGNTIYLIELHQFDTNISRSSLIRRIS